MGQMELARNLLRILIEDYPDNADVWYHAAQASVNDAQRKVFLEKSVGLDPLHHQAANELHQIQTGNFHPQITEPVQSERRQTAKVKKNSNAHFGRRAIAMILDVILLSLVISPFVSIALGIFAPGAEFSMLTLFDDTQVFAIFILISTVIQSFYYGYFLTQQNGQTLGKRLMGIRVIKQDGSKLTIRDALLRNVLGYQISNIIPGLGFLWMLFDKKSRTWHDMMAKTIVVNVR